MTNEQIVKLHDFEARVRQLMMGYRKLREENSALREEVERLKGQIATDQTELTHQKEAYNRLKTARMIEVSGEDVKESRARLSKLIREVDKCIALLDV